MKLKKALVVLCGMLVLVAVLTEPSPAASDGAEGDYRLGPEDVVQIRVWNRADLTGLATLDFAGKIQLPLMGEIDAKGRTTGELSKVLTERYQLLDASISEVLVTVSQYNNQSVAVVGEVRNPGRYGYRVIPDVWTVLLSAGGPTSTAELAHVQIVHADEKAGEPTTTTINLSHGIDDASRATLPKLMPKDTIIVPSRVENTFGGDRIQVLGAVQSPGVFGTAAAGNVIQAISLSGGALPNADLRKVYLTRQTNAGVLSYQLDIEGYLTNARPATDFPLKAGDTILVPSRRSAWSSFVGGIVQLTPLLSIVTAGISLSLAMR
jgi:polysaccharide biosynthesis/export protein